MGDIPNTKVPSPGTEQPLAGESKPSQQLGQTALDQSSKPEPQPRPAILRNNSGATTQNAFSSQFDMAQQSGPGRPGPYHMVQMANALPYNHYRPNQFQGHPPRYGQHASPPMMQMGHASQFMGSPQDSMAPQGYYVPQQQMPQYYAVENHANNNSHQHMQSRQNMAYYAPQVMMGQPQNAPYYVQVSPYHEQHQQHMPQHQPMLPPMMAAPYASGQPATTGRKPSQRTSTRRNRHNNDMQSPAGQFIRLVVEPKPELTRADKGDNKNQNIVRGPPRKPRQSGKYRNDYSNLLETPLN